MVYGLELILASKIKFNLFFSTGVEGLRECTTGTVRAAHWGRIQWPKDVRKLPQPAPDVCQPRKPPAAATGTAEEPDRAADCRR